MPSENEIEQYLTDFEVDVFESGEGKRLVLNMALVGEGVDLEDAFKGLLVALMELNTSMERLVDLMEPPPRAQVN